MRPLFGGKTRVDLRQGGTKSPLKPVAWFVAVFALAVMAAAVVVGMRAVRPPADRSLPEAPSTAVTRPAIPEKGRELQKPLPPVTQAGKEEEAISFPARSDEDPFAPDSSIVRYYRTQGRRPGPMSAEPDTGPDEVRRIIATASAKNASKAATKPSVPEEKPPAEPKEDAKPSSPPVPKPPEPVTVAQLPPTPTPTPQPAPEEAQAGEKGSVAAAEPVGKTGTTEPVDKPGKTATGESAPRAGDTRAGEAVQASEPSQALSGKPSAGNDAGKPGTAKPPSTADKGGGPTAAGAPTTSKGTLTVKESGRESVPPESVAPPRPRVDPPLMLVTGIISTGDSAYAIVKTPQGSSIVRPGDEVGGVTVKSIGEKSITVIKEGEEFVLELGGGGKP